jgi:hypothetical protein
MEMRLEMSQLVLHAYDCCPDPQRDHYFGILS